MSISHFEKIPPLGSCYGILEFRALVASGEISSSSEAYFCTWNQKSSIPVDFHNLTWRPYWARQIWVNDE